MPYKVSDIVRKNGQIGIILQGEIVINNKAIPDGFAIWLSPEDFNVLSEEAIKNLIAEKARERKKLLEQTLIEEDIEHNIKVRLKSIRVDI